MMSASLPTLSRDIATHPSFPLALLSVCFEEVEGVKTLAVLAPCMGDLELPEGVGIREEW